MSAPTAAPKSWWSKNRKWFLPTLILVLVVLPILFLGGSFTVLMSSIKQSEVAKHAFASAQSNSAVIEKLGTPIVIGWLVSGSINVSTASGDADLALPVSGPKGKGKIFVVASKSGNEWSYSRMDVEIEGLPVRINLLAVPAAAAPTAAPGESINLTRDDFRLVFILTETKDGPARAVTPYKPDDNVYAKYDLRGFGLGPQGQVEVGLAVTAVDPAGLTLEKTWTDSVHGTYSGASAAKPINGSYQFHIPDFAPPGSYKLVIKAHDAVKNTDAEFRPTFSVAAVSPIAPATQLEIRNYHFLTAQNGPVLSPAVYAPGETVYYAYNLFGMRFRGDKVSFHTGYRLLGPSGEILIDRPDWDSTEDTVVYHPATFYKEFSGYFTLPSSAVKGTYKQQHTVMDWQSNTVLFHESQFEVR